MGILLFHVCHSPPGQGFCTSVAPEGPPGGPVCRAFLRGEGTSGSEPRVSFAGLLEPTVEGRWSETGTFVITHKRAAACHGDKVTASLPCRLGREPSRAQLNSKVLLLCGHRLSKS